MSVERRRGLQKKADRSDPLPTESYCRDPLGGPDDNNSLSREPVRRRQEKSLHVFYRSGRNKNSRLSQHHKQGKYELIARGESVVERVNRKGEPVEQKGRYFRKGKIVIERVNTEGRTRQAKRSRFSEWENRALGAYP